MIGRTFSIGGNSLKPVRKVVCLAPCLGAVMPEEVQDLWNDAEQGEWPHYWLHLAIKAR